MLAAPSCRPVQPPPALATGERPITGVAQYDRFFADVGASREAVDAARTEDDEARIARGLAKDELMRGIGEEPFIAKLGRHRKDRP